MENLDINRQCCKGILCDKQYCELKHYRCFAGICVDGRQKDQENGKCKDVSCKLLHFCQDAYENELNLQPINGIYRFNICKDLQCKQLKDCPFLHPIWANKYCYDFFMKSCNNNAHQNHLRWKNIKEQVYKECKEKLKMNCNPEENLKDQSNYFNANNICMEYLQGICEKKNGFCAKQHIYWEDLDKIGFIKQKTLRNCIEENSQKNYESLQKYQSQSLLMDEKELKRLQTAIKEQNIIDLIFIMDFTGSMQSWMDVCKSQIKGIIEKFKTSIQVCTLRVGIVGYRDIHDEQQIAYHELTSDIDMITSFIAKQKAKGGGDAAEDVCAGIEKAMALNISKHANSILITILFADAPCHGKQYHNGVSDDLADKVPPNTLENLMKRYYRMKNNNFFTCVNITQYTQKMFDVMKGNFPGLFLSEPCKINQFENLVTLTLKKSLSATQSVKKEQYFAEFRKPKLSEYEITEQEVKNSFWQFFQDQLLKREGETVIEISEKQLSIEERESGQNSVVYKFFDVINNQQVLVKIPKEIAQIKDKNQRIPDPQIQKYETDAEARYLNQARARQLAFIYRERTFGIDGVPPIFFPLPIIYSLQGKKFLGLSKIYGEVYIDLPTAQWKKYSTNGVYLDEKYYYYSAFSHFVFEETQKWFTITDIQGKRNLLSDPAVQTVDNFKGSVITQKDASDLKSRGIGNFMSQHKDCSFICNKLGLNNLSESQVINKQQWKIEREDGKIDAFCESCDAQIELTLQEYKEQNYKMCAACRERYPDVQDNFCQCCRDVFQIKLNQGIALGTNVNKCDSCKLNCKNKSGQKCIYCQMSCISCLLTDKSIGGKQIIICKKSNAYLDTLECQICKYKYDFSIELEKEQYKQGTFYCGGNKCIQRKTK